MERYGCIVKSCYNVGSITISESARYCRAGGISGGSGSAISCFNAGQVEMKFLDGDYYHSCNIGGIIAANESNYATRIANCINYGKILCEQDEGEVTIRVGGITGTVNFENSIENSYWIEESCACGVDNIGSSLTGTNDCKCVKFSDLNSLEILGDDFCIKERKPIP